MPETDTPSEQSRFVSLETLRTAFADIRQHESEITRIQQQISLFTVTLEDLMSRQLATARMQLSQAVRTLVPQALVTNVIDANNLIEINTGTALSMWELALGIDTEHWTALQGDSIVLATHHFQVEQIIRTAAKHAAAGLVGTAALHDYARLSETIQNGSLPGGTQHLILLLRRVGMRSLSVKDGVPSGQAHEECEWLCPRTIVGANAFAELLIQQLCADSKLPDDDPA